jgi:hypothetical protein
MPRTEEAGCHTCLVGAADLSSLCGDLRDADELVSLVQIQRYGRRSQKYAPGSPLPSIMTFLKSDPFAQL